MRDLYDVGCGASTGPTCRSSDSGATVDLSGRRSHLDQLEHGRLPTYASTRLLDHTSQDVCAADTSYTRGGRRSQNRSAWPRRASGRHGRDARAARTTRETSCLHNPYAPPEPLTQAESHTRLWWRPPASMHREAKVQLASDPFLHAASDNCEHNYRTSHKHRLRAPLVRRANRRTTTHSP